MFRAVFASVIGSSRLYIQQQAYVKQLLLLLLLPAASGDEMRFHLIVNKKVQLDATVCRHLFTAQSLYMFRVSQHPSSGVLKTVSATSGIGHDAGTAISFHRGLIRTPVLIRPRWKEVAIPAS